MPVSVIYGLGNPGREYETTRHNAGFRVVSAFAKKLNVDFRKEAAKRERETPSPAANSKASTAGTKFFLLI